MSDYILGSWQQEYAKTVKKVQSLSSDINEYEAKIEEYKAMEKSARETEAEMIKAEPSLSTAMANFEEGYDSSAMDKRSTTNTLKGVKSKVSDVKESLDAIEEEAERKIREYEQKRSDAIVSRQKAINRRDELNIKIRNYKKYKY